MYNYDWGDVYELYVTKDLSISKVAKIKNCSRESVRRALARQNIPIRAYGSDMIGSKHFAWKGGRLRKANGYMMVRLYPDDPFYPMVDHHRYVLEHRLVMAQNLGRCLFGWEYVHHKDGIKDHNEYSNLELTTLKSHSKAHTQGYRDGYAQGLLDGRNKQIDEIWQEHLSQMEEMRKQIRLLTWLLKAKEASHK